TKSNGESVLKIHDLMSGKEQASYSFQGSVHFSQPVVYNDWLFLSTVGEGLVPLRMIPNQD
ncbi:MAG: hypothetical protein KDD61_09250, partial [Bdellovibrionales bacterium]|nr:hypothetical protein [Bdellovibrionales bacterium]